MQATHRKTLEAMPVWLTRIGTRKGWHLKPFMMVMWHSLLSIRRCWMWMPVENVSHLTSRYDRVEHTLTIPPLLVSGERLKLLCMAWRKPTHHVCENVLTVYLEQVSSRDMLSKDCITSSVCAQPSHIQGLISKSYSRVYKIFPNMMIISMRMSLCDAGVLSWRQRCGWS